MAESSTGSSGRGEGQLSTTQGAVGGGSFLTRRAMKGCLLAPKRKETTITSAPSVGTVGRVPHTE